MPMYTVAPPYPDAQELHPSWLFRVSSFPPTRATTMAAANQLILGTEAVYEAKVHPVVVFQILDRALRRSEGQSRVIGTLLGRVENGVAEITNSFAVPHLENGDEVAVGKDYHTQMYELHQRVNENEVIVGWYATTSDANSAGALLDEPACLIHEFYGSVCEMPVHLVVDTSLHSDSLQVSAFVSSPLELVDTALVNQFKQIQVAQKVTEPEAIARTSLFLIRILFLLLEILIPYRLCSERHGARGDDVRRVATHGARRARAGHRQAPRVSRRRKRVRG
jgi:hypothetical protein